jgi:hypothetical protein
LTVDIHKRIVIPVRAMTQEAVMTCVDTAKWYEKNAILFLMWSYGFTMKGIYKSFRGGTR